MRHTLRSLAVAILAGLTAVTCWASITGSISGIVTDPSGAVVTDAVVAAVNPQTGIRTETKTDAKGFYSLPFLPIGTYDLDVRVTGFKGYKQSGLVIDANSALRVDVALQVGQIFEQMTVQTDAVHVETENTQMGEVITGRKMTSVPLNGRSYTDLLALQPGVSPYNAKDVTTPGLDDRPVSGSLSAGNQSVNGQRETSNGFMVNGSSVEEGKNNGTSIIPNLDSIAEFRIITNNFDSEFGSYSGGQVNVATKGGTNAFHGTAFEFLRNTSLDAKNYFADEIGVFRQNQFGGTLGGPIKRNKMFFFVDYQGTRQTQAPTQNMQVPSLADRTGDLSDLAESLAVAQEQSGAAVNGAYWASVLTGRLGYAVSNGEPYYFGPTPDNPSAAPCTSNVDCVFPNALIPQNAWSSATAPLMGFIPTPNAPGNFFTTSSQAQKLRDDKGGIRVDADTHYGTLTAYYFLDDYQLDNPYPNGGANVPGFNATDAGRAHLLTLSDTKTLGATSVNEFRFSFNRSASALFKPQGGLGVTLDSLGFVTPFSGVTGGVGPINPALEGVPFVALDDFGVFFGVPTATTRQMDNSFQWLDNFSKVIGTHTLKFGGQFRYSQINERNFYGENGAYDFTSSETGVDFANFLIGAPDTITQASPQILDSRSKSMGLFFQDSWRARRNLTFNYGVRWEFSQPWYDTQNKIETLVPGQQSKVFPNAPLGWLVPGDKGIPRTLAPTKYDAFAPRLGLAYSPDFDSGFVSKLTGGPGKTSIRVGFGVYFSSVEDLSQFLEVGDAPYGLFWVGSSPVFEAPYTDRVDGSTAQRFPFVFPPTNVSPKNPYNGFDWSLVEPISYGFTFFHKNRMPYSEHYELSIQRQFGANTVSTISYVGNQAHKLITSLDANPGDPALCLFLSDPANLAPGQTQCGPGLQDQSYITATGQTIPTTRPLGPAFSSNPWEIEIANSSYNSLQASLQHSSRWANFLLGYTYSQCIDNASALQDSTNPFNPARSRGFCLFDVTHHFVGSYSVELPFDRWAGSSGWAKKLLGGWGVTGIATFATGLPISLSEDDDNSLTGTFTAPVDVPNYTPGRLLKNTDPRKGGTYFDTSLFSFEELGQIGNARRRFFHGPGINNFDLALLKTTKITETKELQFRFEAFNAFNHTQFKNPDGNINSQSFGVVTDARDPRIMQAALKFLF